MNRSMLLIAVSLLILPLCHGWSCNGQSSALPKRTRASAELATALRSSVATMPPCSNVTVTDHARPVQLQLSSNSRKFSHRKRHPRFYSAASKRWNERFQELRTFYDKNGHCDPEGSENKSLAGWVSLQRNYYAYLSKPEKRHLSFMTAEGIAKLESIGFEWRSRNEANWDKKFAELVQFRDRFGHCHVPTPWKGNPALSAWVSTQRYKYKHGKTGVLTNQQMRKLESIGFLWSPKENTWWSMYRDLVAFQKDHGHCNVPQSYPPNRPLGVWVRHIRWTLREYVQSVSIAQTTNGIVITGLTKERLDALRALDFCWLPDAHLAQLSPPEDIFDYDGGIDTSHTTVCTQCTNQHS